MDYDYLWTGVGVVGWFLTWAFLSWAVIEHRQRKRCEERITEEVRKRAKAAQGWCEDHAENGEMVKVLEATLEETFSKYEALAEKYKALKKQTAGA